MVVADEVAAHDERHAQHGGGRSNPAQRMIRARLERCGDASASMRACSALSDLRIRCGSFSTEFRVAHAPQSPDFAKLGFVGFGLGNPAQNVLFFGRSRVSLQILINKFVFQNNIGLRLDFGLYMRSGLVAPYNGSQHLALYQ